MNNTKCNICLNNHNEWSTERLMKEYLELSKARLNSMFGMNAAKCQTNVAQALFDRNITEIPNIFGPIEIRA